MGACYTPKETRCKGYRFFFKCFKISNRYLKSLCNHFFILYLPFISYTSVIFFTGISTQSWYHGHWANHPTNTRQHRQKHFSSISGPNKIDGKGMHYSLFIPMSFIYVMCISFIILSTRKRKSFSNLSISLN